MKRNQIGFVKTSLFLLWSGFFAAQAACGQTGFSCEGDPRFRQFDFWVGMWDVFDTSGQHVGTNLIEKRDQGCLLLENWTGNAGSTGTSINYFDTQKEKWVQVWVASAGYSIRIEGSFEEGAMRLEGHLISPQGKASPFRGSWALLDDGRVRQFFEQSNDDGATWTSWFEGFYQRQVSE